ncbi:hypothetical protein L9F63_001007, partial [Diploptera punctata]
ISDVEDFDHDFGIAEKRNLIESTKEFNWKNRRIGVILRDTDVVHGNCSFQEESLPSSTIIT